MKLFKINSQNVRAYRNISFLYSDVCILPSDYTGSLVRWYTVKNNCSAEKNTNFKKQHIDLILTLLKWKLFTYYKKLDWLWNIFYFDNYFSKRARVQMSPGVKAYLYRIKSTHPH